MLPCLLASGDESDCKEVSWGIATNFLTESGTVNFPGKVGNNSLTRLLKRATGDLAGALGIYVFSIKPEGNGVVAALRDRNTEHHSKTATNGASGSPSHFVAKGAPSSRGERGYPSRLTPVT